jgi:hypothetical protein
MGVSAIDQRSGVTYAGAGCAAEDLQHDARVMLHSDHPTVFLEPADVGRHLGIAAAQVRNLDALGVLCPAARTARGTRLYLPEDVARVKAAREQKAAAR